MLTLVRPVQFKHQVINVTFAYCPHLHSVCRWFLAGTDSRTHHPPIPCILLHFCMDLDDTDGVFLEKKKKAIGLADSQIEEDKF